MTQSQLLNNLLASFLALYFYLRDKCLDASDYLQEQFQLYSIAAKFIYQQAAPRINSFTTVLICIQITSVLIISFVFFSRIKMLFQGNKKIKLQCGETIEAVRVNRRIPELKALALKAISTDSDRKELKSIETVISTEPQSESPVENFEVFAFRNNNKAEGKSAVASNKAINNNQSEALDDTSDKQLDNQSISLNIPNESDDNQVHRLLIQKDDPEHENKDITDILKSIALLDEKVAETIRSFDVQFTKSVFALDIEMEHFKKYPQLYA